MAWRRHANIMLTTKVAVTNSCNENGNNSKDKRWVKIIVCPDLTDMLACLWPPKHSICLQLWTQNVQLELAGWNLTKFWPIQSIALWIYACPKHLLSVWLADHPSLHRPSMLYEWSCSKLWLYTVNYSWLICFAPPEMSNPRGSSCSPLFSKNRLYAVTVKFEQPQKRLKSS